MKSAHDAAPLDRVLMAIADPTRRRILDLLSGGGARVTDVAASFSISLNSVSKHIQRLEEAALVERHVVGREHHLRFRPERLRTVSDWIAKKQAFWAARLKALDELLTEEDGEKRGRRRRDEESGR